MIEPLAAAGGIGHVHDLGPAAHRAGRHAAAHEFAEEGEVGREAELLGRAAEGETEHQAIVQDEQRAMAVRGFLGAVEESRQGRHDDAGIHDRLQHHRRDLALVALQRPLDGVDLVELGEQRMAGDLALAMQPGLEIAIGAVIAAARLQDQRTDG